MSVDHDRCLFRIGQDGYIVPAEATEPHPGSWEGKRLKFGVSRRAGLAGRTRPAARVDQLISLRCSVPPPAWSEVEGAGVLIILRAKVSGEELHAFQSRRAQTSQKALELLLGKGAHAVLLEGQGSLKQGGKSGESTVVQSVHVCSRRAEAGRLQVHNFSAQARPRRRGAPTAW